MALPLVRGMQRLKRGSDPAVPEAGGATESRQRETLLGFTPKLPNLNFSGREMGKRCPWSLM